MSHDQWHSKLYLGLLICMYSLKSQALSIFGGSLQNSIWFPILELNTYIWLNPFVISSPALNWLLPDPLTHPDSLWFPIDSCGVILLVIFIGFWKFLGMARWKKKKQEEKTWLCIDFRWTLYMLNLCTSVQPCFTVSASKIKVTLYYTVHFSQWVYL